VGASGLIWVGPNPAAMRALGGKIEAKEVAHKAGVPVAPWMKISDQVSDEERSRILKQIGLPLLMKAAHGGGGRGQRIVTREEEFQERFWGDKNLFYETGQTALKEVKGALYAPDLYESFECRGIYDPCEESPSLRFGPLLRAYAGFARRSAAPAGVVHRQGPAGIRREDDAGSAIEFGGALLVFVGDAGDLCRHRTGAGGSWDLWRDGVCGDAADAGDRDPHGARRAHRGCFEARGYARDEARGDRNRRWISRVVGAYAVYREVAGRC